jgi:uncharacterized protein YggE
MTTDPGTRTGTPPRTLTVTGSGRVAVRPDLADLRLGVSITAPTAQAARESSASAMNAIIEGLKALGIADRDLRTSIVSVSPTYDYSANTGTPKLVGYTFTNLVAAVVREVDRLGDAIDAALTAGATNVDQLAFRVEDPSDAERGAREAAVADARAKAETLARAAGVSITGVAAMAESGAAIPYAMPMMELASFKARDAATPVEAGEHEIVVNLVVSYLID